MSSGRKEDINEYDWEFELEMRLLEFTRLPATLRTERTQLLTTVRETIPMKYKLGLVVGRFQPIHCGHILLMEQALETCDRIIVGIGSANVINVDNPFPIDKRERRIRQSLAEHGLTPRIAAVVRLNDYYDDEAWLEEVIGKTKEIGDIDVAVGHNPWVNGILGGAGFPILDGELPLLARPIFEGTTIRQTLREEGLLPQLT